MNKVLKKMIFISSFVFIALTLSSCGINLSDLRRPGSTSTPISSTTTTKPITTTPSTTITTTSTEEPGLKFENVNGEYYVKDVVLNSNTKYLEIPQKAYDGINIVGIRKNAFNKCRNIETLILSDSIREIEEGALNYLGDLQNLTIPFVGGYSNDYRPFGYIFGTKSYSNGVKTRQDYQQNGIYKEANYYIPNKLSYVKLLNQERIFYSQFRNIGSLTYIDLPDNLIQIDNYAFANTGISNISLKDNLNIASTAFNDCNLNGNVSYYGNGIYLGTPSNSYEMLIGIRDFNSTTLTINSNAKIVKYDLFDNYDKIKKLVIPYENKDININIPKNLLLNEAQLSYKQYMNLEYRDSIKSLTLNDMDGYDSNQNDFNESIRNLTSFYFADEIDYNSFSSFDFVNYLSSSVFTTVSKNKYIRSKSNQYFMLAKSTASSSTTVDTSTVVLADNCLSDFYGSITIPASVKYIGNNALNTAYSVKINGTLEYCSSNNFRNIDSNYNIYSGLRYIGDSSNYYKYLIGTNNSSSSYQIIPDAKVVMNYAFCDNSNVRYIYFNSDIEEIGDYAFQNTKIYSLYLPNGLKRIGKGIVDGCENLSLNSYGGGKYLGTQNNLYYYFVKPIDRTITDITINSICNFAELDSLSDNEIKKLIIPADTKLSYDIFNILSIKDTLTEAQIPVTLYKGISDNYYNSLNNLQSLTLTNPNNIDIDYLWIRISDNLNKIVLPENIKELYIENFNNKFNSYISYNNGYYIGTNNNNYYYFIKPSNDSIQSITFHNDTKVIARGAFSNNYYIQSISGGSIESIGSNAFSWCTNLSTIDSINSVTYFGSEVFNNCYNIGTYIDGSKYIGNSFNPYMYLISGSNIINKDTKYISTNAFSNNDSVTGIDIPAGVETLGYEAFRNCSNLKTLKINTSLKSFNLDIVYGCEKLEYIYLKSVKNIYFNYYKLASINLNNLKYIYYEDSYTSLAEYDYLSDEIKDILYFYSASAPTDTNHQYYYVENGQYKLW